MHPLQVVAECMFVDEISLGIGGLGLCTRTSAPLTSLIKMSFQLQSQLTDEPLITLQLGGCIFGVATSVLLNR